MPVAFHRDMEELWLDSSVDYPSALGNMLTPYSPEAMEAFEVSTPVNSASNGGPEVIVAVA